MQVSTTETMSDPISSRATPLQAMQRRDLIISMQHGLLIHTEHYRCDICFLFMQKYQENKKLLHRLIYRKYTIELRQDP